jgi:mannose-6-phosphate isomerase-like protein (cupin superfamily)
MASETELVAAAGLADLFAAPLTGGLLAPAGSSIVLAEWGDPGGITETPRYIAPLHVHHEDDEAWYVLDGVLRHRLGDGEVETQAGGAVIAPRGTPHTFWNPSPDPVRYLLIMTPRIKRLIDALHALSSSDPQAVGAVFREHESEFIGWP